MSPILLWNKLRSQRRFLEFLPSSIDFLQGLQMFTWPTRDNASCCEGSPSPLWPPHRTPADRQEASWTMSCGETERLSERPSPSLCHRPMRRKQKGLRRLLLRSSRGLHQPLPLHPCADAGADVGVRRTGSRGLLSEALIQSRRVSASEFT